MKSLEHIIREIREGKAEKGSKKTLEGSIRKVMKGEKESSFADRTTKPITDDVGGLAGSGTGGEPKLHAEAIGVIGTDDYKGNQFKSVRTQTPHIKPPAGPGSHSQAPENVSRQRTLAKERSSMTLHGKVTEEDLNEFQVKTAEPPVKIAEPVVKSAIKTAAKTAVGRAVGVMVGPEAMIGQEIAPELAARYQQQHKSLIPHPETPGVSTSTSFERMKGFKVAPTKPAETRPEVKPKVTPSVEPKPLEVPGTDAPDTKTKTEVKPETKTGVVQLPAIDIGTKTAAKTDVAPATAAKTATDTATTTSDPEEKKRFPLSFGAMATPDVFGAQKGITSKHPSASKARLHRRHVSEEVANEIRKKIQNMPRPDAGDRKSIEYVGRKDSDPKSDKQKTSRLATIKNVIDEAKKIKFEAEFGKEKKYVYPNDTEVVIGPNMKRNFLDVEDSKLPKDYENK